MDEIIKKWYRDAEDLLLFMRNLRQLGCQQMRTSSSYAEGDFNQEQIGQFLQAELQTRSLIADKLYSAREILLVRTAQLRLVLRERLSDRLALAAAEFEEFELDGLTPGPFLWASFEDLCGKMRHWTRYVAPYWESAEIEVSQQFLSALQQLQNACPFTESRFNAMRNRILRERSRLLRDLNEHPPKEKTDNEGMTVPNYSSVWNGEQQSSAAEHEPIQDGPRDLSFWFNGKSYDGLIGNPYRFLEWAWTHNRKADLRDSTAAGTILDDHSVTTIDESQVKNIRDKCNEFFRNHQLPFTVSKARKDQFLILKKK